MGQQVSRIVAKWKQIRRSNKVKKTYARIGRWVKSKAHERKQNERIRKEIVDKAKAELSKEKGEKYSLTSTDAFREAYGNEFIQGFPRFSKGNIVVTIANTSYESKVGVEFVVSALGERRVEIGVAKLGFDRGAVIIEAIQGKRTGAKTNHQANAQSGEPWQNHLLKIVEERARDKGYTEVRIRRPETLYWYKFPILSSQLPIPHNQRKEDIQRRMRTLYQKIADALGYHKEREYYVKKLG